VEEEGGAGLLAVVCDKEDDFRLLLVEDPMLQGLLICHHLIEHLLSIAKLPDGPQNEQGILFRCTARRAGSVRMIPLLAWLALVPSRNPMMPEMHVSGA